MIIFKIHACQVLKDIAARTCLAPFPEAPEKDALSCPRHVHDGDPCLEDVHFQYHGALKTLKYRYQLLGASLPVAAATQIVNLGNSAPKHASRAVVIFSACIFSPGEHLIQQSINVEFLHRTPEFVSGKQGKDAECNQPSLNYDTKL